MLKLALLLTALATPALAGATEISKCWMTGSATADTLRSVVDVLATVNPDGSVEKVEIVAATAPTDNAKRTAFEIANRAIRRCARNEPSFAGKTVLLRSDYSEMRVTLLPEQLTNPEITDI